jgi:dipeptidyl aminopeptidase/acylaminoacyl peptidase
VATGTGDYGFAPDGRLALTVRGRDGYDLMLLSGARERARALGRGVQSFAFARDGSALAFLSGASPGTPGDLHATPADGRAVRLGTRVGEYRWSAQGPRLAWLQDFDPRIRAGTLAVGGPGQRIRELARNVTAWAFSPDGGRIAFLEHATAGGYSVDLKLADLAAGVKPEVVARGVFGFDFSPEGDRLYYRAGCTRNAEACDLHVLPAAGLPPGKLPEAIAGGVKSFEFDRWTPGRLLVTWARRDMLALDLAVWDGRKLLSIDTAALPGSAQLLPPDGRRVTYAVIDPRRAGIYVAEVPR